MSVDSTTPSHSVNESWRQRFRQLRGELTAAEQRAGEYFENHAESVYQSITEVVANSGIGYGSIVRFCQKLGYRGFQEFKLMLATDGVVRARSLNGPNSIHESEVERQIK